MKIIGIEEHWISRAFKQDYPAPGTPGNDADVDLLADLGDDRIAVMDREGIAMQVLGHGAFPAATAPVQKVVDTNDQVAAAVAGRPDRFAAFAALPFLDIGSAVSELERTVTRLGFKGAMINGTIADHFLDHPRFRPLLAKAEALEVPLYLHPFYPIADVGRHYYEGDFSDLVSFTLGTTAAGWHWETGLHVLRLIVSGIFDEYPKLQIIIGHLGELIPFYWERIGTWLEPRVKNLDRPVRDYFRSNIHVTTSGYSTLPPFELALKIFGADRMIFSVDYPFNKIAPCVEFLKTMAVSEQEREMIAGGNAARLLRL